MTETLDGSIDARPTVEGAPRTWGDRLVPAGFAVLIVASGLLYSFNVIPRVDHVVAWGQPLDLWDTYKVAHLVAWGDLGDSYTISGFLSFPGIAVLLAPVAWLTGQLGLHDSYPWYIPHASAWPILAPFALLVGTLALFGSDALASHFGITRRRRIVLGAAQTVILWPVLVMWGHPEDAIALGLALYAMLATLRGRWRSAGWLFGLGIVFQPLVLLLLPVYLATAPARDRLRMLVRGAVPSIALLAIPLVQSWHATTYALVDQPTYPKVDHPTPLLVLAPHLSTIGRIPAGVKTEVVHGHRRFVELYINGGQVVAPGPGRLLALLVAVLLGLWVWRKQPTARSVVWLGVVALTSWCALEAVMVPYYLWPALALMLVAAATVEWWRLGVVLGVALFCTVWSERHLSPWMYWAPLVLALAIGLAATRPGRSNGGRRAAGSGDPVDGGAIAPAVHGPASNDAVGGVARTGHG